MSKDIRVQVRIDSKTHAEVKKAAEKDHRAISEWIRLAILRSLGRAK